MDKAFTLELLEWLHRFALADEARAQAEDEKKTLTSTIEAKRFHESRRIGFLWRADFARDRQRDKTTRSPLKRQLVPSQETSRRRSHEARPTAP